jgi:hypothetical protein
MPNKILFVIIIFIICLGTLTAIASMLIEHYELQHYGTKVYARILRQHPQMYNHGDIINNTSIKYTVNKVTFIKLMAIDTKYTFSVNDSLILNCSTRSPLTNKVLGVRINGIDHLQTD